MSHDKHEAADTAMHRAFDAAERVAMMLDRHAYDNGDDPEVIQAWTERLLQLEREIVKTLGEPRTRLPSGALVPTSMLKVGAKS
jgi:hypothetical protein